MQFDLDDREAQYLVSVLLDAHKNLLHDLHHTDAGQYKDRVEEQVALNDSLMRRLRSAGAQA
jgi:hypothetical protein